MSLILIPEEECKPDYYVQGALDASLRFVYEVSEYARQFDSSKCVYTDRDVVYVSWFICEKLVEVMSARDRLEELINADFIGKLSGPQAETLKACAMYQVAAAASKVIERLNSVNDKLWHKSSWGRGNPSTPAIREGHDGTLSIDAYSSCRQYVDILRSGVDMFRDMEPDWEYQSMIVSYFEKNVDKIKWYNEAYEPHIAQDVEAYNALEKEVREWCSKYGGITVIEAESVKKWDWFKQQGKERLYVVCCGDCLKKNSDTGKYEDYFIPLSSFDNEADALNELKKVKEITFKVTGEPYYRRTRVIKLDSEGEQQSVWNCDMEEEFMCQID